MTEYIDFRVPHWSDEANQDFDGAWHRALNNYEASFGSGERRPPEQDGKHFMYEAKRVSQEVPRLALLFRMEREGKLRKIHKQCSHDHIGQQVPDNHLTCCLGVECRACPHLAVIDGVQTRHVYEDFRRDENGKGEWTITDMPIPDEQRDLLKAWTCATHILMRGGDTAGEGYLMTVDDRMYWDNVYRSLASEHEEI